jgi:hypothetical protein
LPLGTLDADGVDVGRSGFTTITEGVDSSGNSDNKELTNGTSEGNGRDLYQGLGSAKNGKEIG